MHIPLFYMLAINKHYLYIYIYMILSFVFFFCSLLLFLYPRCFEARAGQMGMAVVSKQQE